MRKIGFLALAIGLLWLVACSGSGDWDNSLVVRSADPCNTWEKWQSGPAAIITPELRDGQASHLMPAEIIYYSVVENTNASQGILINPVLILAYLENNDLLSQGAGYEDFEMRLLKAVGYGLETKKYHGFYPQLVASTYQWWLFQLRGLPFAEAQEAYPFDSETKTFAETYAEYAQIMNELLGTNFELFPSSQGYYQDFAGLVGIADIQRFLEQVGSPLQANLFNQFPLTESELDYADPSAHCGE